MAVDDAMLDEIAARVAGGLRLVGGVKREAEAQLKSGLTTVLSELDVVTDERMRVQETMLVRAREDLDRLERRVEALEARLGESDSGA